MKTVITGATGFLGVEVSKLFPNAIKLNKKAYNLTDNYEVYSLFRELSPQTLIHLAADVGGLTYNINNPATIYYNNILMNTHIINECAKNKVRIIFISSTCAYPAHPYMPTNELHLWDGEPERSNLSYGVTKRIALSQLEAYKEQYGLEYEYLLLANMYGPGDRSNHVIPDLIKRFLSNPPEVEIWGNGQQTRDFLFVKDAARAIKHFTDNPLQEPVNIANGLSISIKQLVEHLAEYTEYKGKIFYNQKRPMGQIKRSYNVDKAKQKGFSTETTMAEGLKETVKWYRQL